jgi:hypothetical protein
LSIVLLVNGGPQERIAVMVLLNALQKESLSCIPSELGVSIHSKYQAKKTSVENYRLMASQQADIACSIVA